MNMIEILFGPAISVGEVSLAWIWVVVILIVALVLAYAMQPKPQQMKPAALEDFEFPVAEDGKAAALIFGDVWTEDPNVLWFGDLYTRPIKSKSK